LWALISLQRKSLGPACYTLLKEEKNKLGENFVFVSLKKVPLIRWNFLMAPAAVHLEIFLADGWAFSAPIKAGTQKLPC
jgi:hypothetical protein